METARSRLRSNNSLRPPIPGSLAEGSYEGSILSDVSDSDSILTDMISPSMNASSLPFPGDLAALDDDEEGIDETSPRSLFIERDQNGKIKRRRRKRRTYRRRSLHEGLSSVSFKLLRRDRQNTMDPFEAALVAAGVLEDQKEEFGVDVLYENQRGLVVFGLPKFSGNTLFEFDPPAWTDKYHRRSPYTIDDYPLINLSWQWAHSEWFVDMSGDVDELGWQYGLRFGSRTWKGVPDFYRSFVRRRKWIRGRYRQATKVGRPFPMPEIREPDGELLGPAAQLPFPRQKSEEIASWDPGSDFTNPFLPFSFVLNEGKQLLIRRAKERQQTLADDASDTLGQTEDEIIESWRQAVIEINFRRTRRVLRLCKLDRERIELWRLWLNADAQEQMMREEQEAIDCKGKRRDDGEDVRRSDSPPALQATDWATGMSNKPNMDDVWVLVEAKLDPLLQQFDYQSARTRFLLTLMSLHPGGHPRHRAQTVSVGGHLPLFVPPPQHGASEGYGDTADHLATARASWTYGPRLEFYTDIEKLHYLNDRMHRQLAEGREIDNPDDQADEAMEPRKPELSLIDSVQLPSRPGSPSGVPNTANKDWLAPRLESHGSLPRAPSPRPELQMSFNRMTGGTAPLVSSPTNLHTFHWLPPPRHGGSPVRPSPQPIRATMRSSPPPLIRRKTTSSPPTSPVRDGLHLRLGESQGALNTGWSFARSGPPSPLGPSPPLAGSIGPSNGPQWLDRDGSVRNRSPLLRASSAASPQGQSTSPSLSPSLAAAVASLGGLTDPSRLDLSDEPTPVSSAEPAPIIG